MNKRIKDKVKEIEMYLNELDEIMPANLKEYLDDIKEKAACERYFEKIVEACVDLAFLVIKEKGFRVPEDDSESFDILFKENIINSDLAENLKDAKGMRNIIAHQYGSIDDELVFDSITQEISKDVASFIKLVKKIK